MIRTAAILILCAVTVQAQMDRRVLEIRRQAVCRGGVVRFGDLVFNGELLSPDEQELALQDGLPEGRYLSLVSLAYLLQRHDTLRDVRLHGPQWITLQHIASPAQLARAREAIRTTLESRPPWQGWTVDIVFSDNDDRLLAKVPEFDHVQVQPVDARQVLGHVGLRLSFRDAEDRAVEELTIAPEISRQAEVLVLARHVDRGTVLGAADLRTATIWAGAAHADVVTDPAAAVGLETMRDLDTGAMLRSPMLREPICARRGDEVWVSCTVRGLSVRLPAQAMETGRQGDRIKVMNTRSRKIFEAELIGDHLLVVVAGNSRS